MEQALLSKLSVFKEPRAELEKPEVELVAAEQAEEERNAAFLAGFEDGKSHAEHSFEERQSVLEETVKGLLQQVDEVSTQIEASHRRAIYSILRAALPKLVKSGAAEEIVDIIASAAKGRISGKVSIRAGVTLAQELAPRLQSIPGLDHVSLVPDGSLDGLAASLSWDGGGGEIDFDKVTEKCLSVLHQKDEAV